jgi:hypothetical protein
VGVITGAPATEAVYNTYARSLNLMKPGNESWAVVAHATEAYTPYYTESHQLQMPNTVVAKYLEEAALPVFVSVAWQEDIVEKKKLVSLDFIFLFLFFN